MANSCIDFVTGHLEGDRSASRSCGGRGNCDTSARNKPTFRSCAQHSFTSVRSFQRLPNEARDAGGSMITLYGFGRIFPQGRGETKDLWAQWALEETGLPYRVHALDHTAGDLESEAYGQISPFRQAPVIDDDGFVVAESAAIMLYLAEKAGRLIPSDVQG